MSNNISTQVPLLANQQQQQQPPVANGNNHHQEDQNMRAPYRQSKMVRYMECLKNHATGSGGHTTDGCGEFMAGGPEGTFEALICCVCNCHRNFHRQVIIHPCPNRFCCHIPVTSPVQQVLANQEEEASVRPKKRFRTKFTAEQKEKLNSFAEKSSWKIPKPGDPEVSRICEEVGIGRQVLKVWMHNNKYHPNRKA